jgi:hypothetical protein
MRIIQADLDPQLPCDTGEHPFPVLVPDSVIAAFTVESGASPRITGEVLMHLAVHRAVRFREDPGWP